MVDENILGATDADTDSTNPVDQLDFNQLKQWTKMFGVETQPTWKKSDYVTAIKQHLAEATQAKILKAEEAKNAAPPGYARVIFNKDATPGASNRAVFMGVNGRIMQAPRGILVEVPIPHLESLDNSITVHTQNSNPNAADARGETFEEIRSQSYPYIVKSITPGPFVNPNDQRAQNYKQRHYMATKYKHWPLAGELKSAMDRGMFDTPEFEAHDPTTK